jgi:hypothetical protein
MSTRGTAIDRVLNFYRTASHDTVRVTHQLALEVMAERGIGAKKAKGPSLVKRTRRSKSATTQPDSTSGAAGSGGN